jgi:transcriptional regulator with XRE-family HTH domain
MDTRTEVRDFLTSRRARLTPQDVGLPAYGTPRRVKGLRREEVAILAGVSVEYYNRMERGNLSGVSESVLDALASALRLDEAERVHLSDLARAANHSNSSGRRRTGQQRIRQTIHRILDGMTAVPAYARNGRLDILAVNQLGAALLPELMSWPGTPNLGRYLFLDPRSRDFYADWQAVARDCVAALRIEAGRNPYDRGLTDLIGELSTRSEPFREWWGSHNVRLHTSATKQLRHPIAGDMEVTGEALEVPADPGLTIIAYTVEPASPSEQALRFLASWSGQQSHQAAADHKA